MLILSHFVSFRLVAFRLAVVLVRVLVSYSSHHSVQSQPYFQNGGGATTRRRRQRPRRRRRRRHFRLRLLTTRTYSYIKIIEKNMRRGGGDATSTLTITATFILATIIVPRLYLLYVRSYVRTHNMYNKFITI